MGRGGEGEGRGQREDYGIEKITKSKPMRFTTIFVTFTFLLYICVVVP